MATQLQGPFSGISTIDEYRLVEKLGEGTFGEVHKAQHKATGLLVAVKKIILHNSEEGFPITALREIRILKALDHPNIIPLLDMSIERGSAASGVRSAMFMATPYMDHDLTGLLENQAVNLNLAQIKCYMIQLLHGINYIHQQGFLHRDVKASNILIDNNGIVKIADFGLARRYLGEPPTIKGAGQATHSYTSMVVTRWYRPPELILGDSRYTTAIDMWGVGCVFGEMFRRKPILQGGSDIDQGHLIFKLLGSPTNDSMPGFDRLPVAQKINFGPYTRQFESAFGDLPVLARVYLGQMLVLNPEKRLSALGALDHEFFRADPQPARPQDLPKYKESHELTARQNRNKPDPQQHPRPPHAPTADTHDYQNNQRNGYRSGGHNNDGWSEYGGHRNRNRQNNRAPQPPYRRRNDERSEVDLVPPYRRNRQVLNYDEDSR